MNCPHCGRPIAALASENEQRMIAVLAGVKGWVSKVDDLGYIRGLGLEFGLTEAELLGVVKDMAAWLDDRPNEKGGRGRLRNFCKTAARDRRQAPVTQERYYTGPPPVDTRTLVQIQAEKLGWKIGRPVLVDGVSMGIFDGKEIVPDADSR